MCGSRIRVTRERTVDSEPPSLSAMEENVARPKVDRGGVGPGLEVPATLAHNVVPVQGQRGEAREDLDAPAATAERIAARAAAAREYPH